MNKNENSDANEREHAESKQPSAKPSIVGIGGVGGKRQGVARILRGFARPTSKE